MDRISLVLACLICGGVIASTAFAADETITLTTYYPSPYGVYQRLHSDSMSIGSGYSGNTPPADGLIVQGNVGIGTGSPAYELDVNGTVYGISSSGTAAVWGVGSGGSGVRGDGDNWGVTGYSDAGKGVYGFTNSGVAGYFKTVGSGYGLIVESGNVGIGTATPGNKLDVSGGNGVGASISVGQMTQAEGSTQVNANTYNVGRSYFSSSWDDNFRISTFDDTPNPNWAIGIGDGAGGFSGSKYMTMDAAGNVGIGATPKTRLDIGDGTDTGGILTVRGDQNAIQYRDSSGNLRFLTGLRSDVDSNLNYIFYSYGGANWIFNDGNVGIGTTTPAGTLDVNGRIYQRGAVLHSDYVFEPDYDLESIEDHSEYMWREKHLKAVPKGRKDGQGQDVVEIGAHRKGILEELEKAHIYIQQINERVKLLEEKIRALGD